MNYERVNCERCGAVGRRPLTHIAPGGWLYLETVVEQPPGSPAPTPPDKLITYACTPTCAEALWQQGPGPQVPGVGELVAQAMKRLDAGLPLDIPTALTPADIERIAARVVAAQKHAPCTLTEGVCNAADCPEHGWVPSDG